MTPLPADEFFLKAEKIIKTNTILKKDGRHIVLEELELDIADALVEAEAGERERIKQIMRRKYCGELMEEDVDPPQKENHI